MRVILVYKQLIFQHQDLKQTNFKNLTKTIVDILMTYKLINEEKVKSRRVNDFPKQCPKQAKLRSKAC